MPKSLANALSPPAADMSDRDSLGSMARKSTRAVYQKSNDLCNPTLNVSFRVTAVALFWKDLLRLADKHLRIGEAEFRKLLGEHEVSVQTITNWKGKKGTTGRPVPVARYPLLSQIFGISTDELHGQVPDSPQRESDGVSEVRRLLADLMTLDEADRRTVTALVHSLAAKPALRKKAR